MIFDEKFWLCVSFIIFVYFTYKPIKRAILSILDDKILEITSKLRESQKLRQDAENLLEDVQKELEQLIVQRQQQEQNNKLLVEQLQNTGEERIQELITIQQKQLSDLVGQYQRRARIQLKNDIIETTTQLVEQYCCDMGNGIDKQEHIKIGQKKLKLDDIEIAKNLISSSYKIGNN